MTGPRTIDHADVEHVFVYGTLRPGESRWHHLERFVADDGVDDSVTGRLYDTRQGYPAALFDGEERIIGRTYVLARSTITDALTHLDDVEGAVAGLYRRVILTTAAGRTVFAYEYGGGLDLVPIPSGDWLSR